LSGEEAAPAPRPRRSWLPFLPVAVFGCVAAAFGYSMYLGKDAQEIPSVLVGRSAPQTVLPPLDGLTDAAGRPVPGLDLTGFGDGRPVLVNVFASWCVPCRDEHPLLMDLSEDGRLSIVAINYKDQPENARAFLAQLGNPFDALGVDPKGSATIDWGVYGVPESFLVSASGEIVYKQTGPFTAESVRTGLLPALDRLAPAGIPAADTGAPAPDRAG
jgi:cytochrome c biogenesis protein CcmG, thiol:disulfide interchange protein DsbE